ncbi:unnamed protein product [Clonostachys solani]|uniref:Uncharacterized protein n=1 Tax=Clonostachys solani TaxID=160281 RepID=A0A9N9ZAI2_9HYPO|nr:unnamed protein product [Clonostachys solani]
MTSSSATKHQDQGVHQEDISRTYTAGGHVEDRSQPGLPTIHRKLANPSPLGFLSFATSMFLISTFGIHARGVAIPNVMIAVLICFGGVAQYIAGIVEFMTGNTFGASVFVSYGAFNLSYGLIYLPGTGIISAYTDDKTGQLSSSFNQAIAIYVWAWFILTVIFTLGAIRGSWVLFIDLLLLDVVLLMLAAGLMVDNSKLTLAAYSLGYIVAFLSYWAGSAGLLSGATPFELPMFPMFADRD